MVPRELESIVTELYKAGLHSLLDAKVKRDKGNTLYNQEAIRTMRGLFDEWGKKRLSEADKKDFSKPVNAILGSRERTPRPLLSSPLDVPNLDYILDLGFPGAEPLTRGVHPNMYRGRKFTIRPIVGFGTPEDTNERIHFLLDHGATGVNIVFDLPTIQEYDSDDPQAAGQVGLCGVSVQTMDDMNILWHDVPIEEMSVSLTTHYPSNTMILMAMYLAMAEERGIEWGKLKGTVQNDLVMESVVRSAPDTLPTKSIFKLQVDNVEYLRKNVPLWNYVSLNGYNLREGGVDEITEVAVAFSNALETIKEMTRRGHEPDTYLDRMAFFWVVGNDFFAEVAKMRAARRLWYRITKHILKCRSEKSTQCRFHVQTSGISLTRVEPMNNIPRATLHGLAAVLGGAQSLHLSGFDEAYSVPTEEAHLLSVRTQQIIQDETGIADVVDPLGGSFYVEWLTNELEKNIVQEIDEILQAGGLVKAIEGGWLQDKIARYIVDEQELQEEGKIRVVGVNSQKAEKPRESKIDVFRYPANAEERQRRRLEKIRKTRNNEAVVDRLERIADAAKRAENLFPYVLDAVRDRATEGEVAKTLKRIYGVSRVRIHL